MTTPIVGTVFVHRENFIHPMMIVESANESVISYKKARSVDVHCMSIAEWSRDLHSREIIVIYEPQKGEDIVL